MLLLSRRDIITNNLGQKSRKMCQNGPKIAVFGDFEHFGTPQSCPEGKDPPKHLKIQNFFIKIVKLDHQMPISSIYDVL